LLPQIKLISFYFVFTGSQNPDPTKVNVLLASAGFSPLVQPRKKQRVTYVTRKLVEVETVSRNIIESHLNIEEDNVLYDSAEACSIVQDAVESIKSRIHQVEREEQIMLLSLFAKQWTIEKISTTFGVSSRLAKSAKKVAIEKGVLNFPDKHVKNGPTALPEETKELVHMFYFDSEVSRCLPGQQDVIDNKQKYLLMDNLRDVYSFFKEKNPHVKIGFSSFCILRPKNCIFAGPTCSQITCLCIVHQNIKLLLRAGGNSNPSTRHLFNSVMCEDPTISCAFSTCKKCPSEIGIQNILKPLQETMHDVESIGYFKWEQVNIGETRKKICLINKTIKSDEYITLLKSEIRNAVFHEFCTRKQGKFISALKEKLVQGEIVVHQDFAENYGVFIQDSVQGAHWNNQQLTVFPSIVYYKTESTIQTMCYVFISDDNKHENEAVFAFNKVLMDNIKKQIPVSKVYFVTDGAVTQFKNYKQFINIAMFSTDYNIVAEQHFFASGHGKGACDGIGATVKRMCRKASVQGKSITTAQEFCNYVNENMQNIDAVLVDTETISKYRKLLDHRFLNARRVKGIRKIHAVKCVPGETYPVVETKIVSTMDQWTKTTLSDFKTSELKLKNDE
jgi:hypothetical protein